MGQGFIFSQSHLKLGEVKTTSTESSFSLILLLWLLLLLLSFKFLELLSKIGLFEFLPTICCLLLSPLLQLCCLFSRLIHFLMNLSAQTSFALQIREREIYILIRFIKAEDLSLPSLSLYYFSGMENKERQQRNLPDHTHVLTYISCLNRTSESSKLGAKQRTIILTIFF